MLSKALLLLLLVFFCSAVFSLKCYDGSRSKIDGKTEDEPISESKCENSKYCEKTRIHGTIVDKGVKKQVFSSFSGCDVRRLCESDGCHERPPRFVSKYGDIDGTVCCCSSDFCFGKDDVEKFIKEKSGGVAEGSSSRRPLLFIPLVVLLRL